MSLTEHQAREILDIAHAAWSKGDIEGILDQYTDDLTYWSNIGAPDGSPLILHGKDDFRAMLKSFAQFTESVSVTETFNFSHGVGRARVESYIRHLQTGHSLSGSFRQVVTYRGNKIVRLDEYHDAARMAAFWRLVTTEVTDAEIEARSKDWSLIVLDASAAESISIDNQTPKPNS